MSKLVDKKRLAKLAKALDDRAKAAVAAEKERAMAAEQAIEAKADVNKAAIDAINHAETGLLKQAENKAQELVNGEASRAQGVEEGLAGRIETLEGIVGKDTGAGTLASLLESVAGNTAAASANTAAIAKLNGKADEEGSVAKAVADAVKAEEDRAKEAEQGLDDKIQALDAKFGEAADDFFNDLKGDEGTTIGGMVADIAENKAKLAGIADEDEAVKEGAVIENAKLVDVAPTLAAVLGQTLPEADGRVLTELLK
jgi:hypothetical protein